MTEAELAAHEKARALHNPFCSAGGWPCPIHCETWPKCAAEMFPNLTNACPDLCPVHTSPEFFEREEWAPGYPFCVCGKGYLRPNKFNDGHDWSPCESCGSRTPAPPLNQRKGS